MKVLVLADTHVRAGGSRTLPDAVWAAADKADLVLHAGDVLTAGLLDDLARRAPTHAVLGNNDVGLRAALPEVLELDLDGVALAMIHDSGPSAGRARRLRRRFPDADLVVFGHSHLPLDEEGVDGQRLFNPGSPTERRRAPTRTFGWLELAGGRTLTHRIVDIT